MLRITGFAPVQDAPDVEYDEYVPVTITWPSYHRGLAAPASHVTGGVGGYLELKYDRPTGELIEVVLVSASAVASNEPLSVPVEGLQMVTPLIDVELLGGERTRDEARLNVICYEDALELRIGDDPPSRLVHGGTVNFGVGQDDELASIVVMWPKGQREEFLKLYG